ncbi:MAG: ABC transporter ATP-binding protein [Deltaproteobacteria bacterium]|nr:ABC transporter ATP-binding protein [Deltaproteobacteria bacterium]MBT8358608.1 ABC transporter ATP-binding protein [Deltaproteobacteria bacterium]MBT8373303.1 ABC transporter ATP-binding protein [Deltaproteobacteria bacterium]NNL43557.1 ABC transporter ATP-binding protein [Desulfobacterales bacterium]
MENLVSIRELHKSFNSSKTRLEILKGVNFDLKTGDTLSVVGPSGIGKSTFLHILGTLDRPDKGQILYRGDDVFLFNDEQLAKFRNEFIGFVFQFHHLLPEFSALENTMMPALIKNMTKNRAKEDAEEILVRVGLKDRLSHRVGKLSGGEQQRVALARALVLKPVILLADEPTGNLDKKNSHQVHDLMLELNRELHMTLVVVTHNLELASYMSRCVTVVDGLLVETNSRL